MSLVTRKTITITAFILCLAVMGLLAAALSFEFLIEELAKLYVVPIMITAMFTSVALLAVIAKSLTLQ